MVSMSKLSRDILVQQILVRLDVKDVIRCKSVCKLWRSFISDPPSSFAKLHLEHNTNHDTFTTTKRIRVFKPRTRAQQYIRVCYSDKHPYRTILVGSCNGLVCISSSPRDLYVANPFTREVIKIHDSPISRFLDCLAVIVTFWGFGYDSSTDDYKIVLGIYLRCCKSEFHVLSLKTNVWKNLGQQPYIYTSKAATFFNGVLHWVMGDRNYNRCILSFDLSLEEFKEFPLPSPHKYMPPNPTLGIAKGCLCIFDSRLPYDGYVWLMKEYNVQQSWTRVPFFLKREEDEAIYFFDVEKEYPPNKGVFDTDHIIMSSTWEALLDPIFVPSLVSPRVIYRTLKRKREPENNDKLIKGDPLAT